MRSKHLVLRIPSEIFALKALSDPSSEIYTAGITYQKEEM